MRGMIFCKRCGNYAADGLEACPKCNSNLFEFGHPSLVGGIVKPAGASTPSAAQTSGGAMLGGGTEPAGHLKRFLSLVIDSILQSLIVGVGFAAGYFIGGTAGLIAMGVTLLLMLVYEPYFIASKGATPGKSAMSLRVVNREGGPVSAGQSVARYLLKQILSGFFIPWFVPLFSDRRRALHDMIVGTYVVQA